MYRIGVDYKASLDQHTNFTIDNPLINPIRMIIPESYVYIGSFIRYFVLDN